MDAPAERRDLFPEIKPYEHGELAVGGPHKVYWEQSGNADGVAAVFLHGGPGAGATPAHRCFFDPTHYRIVIFDQRGAGRSTPTAELEQNTTDHLIEDMERLRRHLRIERWLVFGGSWGATLALAYGIRHPERCLGFVLRGIFLGRRQELDWFLYGARSIWPEAWRAFSEFLPADERNDLLKSYHRRLIDADAAIHMPAAAAWSRYESACSRLISGSDKGAGEAGGRSSLSLARIEAHYITNAMFMSENHVLENIARVRDIPAAIVQGRYDMICPIATADELARAWTAAEYVIVPDAGHSAMETGIRSALVAATETFKTLG